MPADPRVVLRFKSVRRLWRPSTVRADVASTKAETPIFWSLVNEHFPKVSGATRFLQATEPNVVPEESDPDLFVALYQGGDPVPVAHVDRWAG